MRGGLVAPTGRYLAKEKEDVGQMFDPGGGGFGGGFGGGGDGEVGPDSEIRNKKPCGAAVLHFFKEKSGVNTKLLFPA